MIRPVGTDDLTDLYSICLATGAAGMDASAQYRDHDLLGHVYAGPYVSVEGTMGFVYEDADGVAGYVLAALDTARFEERCEQEWWPPLRLQYSQLGSDSDAGSGSGADGHHLNESFMDDVLVRHIWNPPTTDVAVLEQFPAHLHIDLLPRLQGKGAGRELIQTLLDALRARGVAGVHFGIDPANARAIGFYQHLGFTQLQTDGLVMGMIL